MAVNFEDSRSGFGWPEPLTAEPMVSALEERIDRALREGDRSAYINRTGQHLDTISVRVTDDPFAGSDLRDSPHVLRALEFRYRAAGWDSARVEFSEASGTPYLVLGRARHPVLVSTPHGPVRVGSNAEEAPEDAAQRVLREGVCVPREESIIYVPPGQLESVVMSPIPEILPPNL